MKDDAFDDVQCPSTTKRNSRKRVKRSMQRSGGTCQITARKTSDGYPRGSAFRPPSFQLLQRDTGTSAAGVGDPRHLVSRTVEVNCRLVCHNLPYVWTLPIVAAEAANRGLLRDCSVGRRLESALQHRSHPANPGDPPASKGTCPSDFNDAVGLDSELGKRHFHCNEHSS
jgi:hypothetical protein